jgi:uncharacterized protein (DUF486 family)
MQRAIFTVLLLVGSNVFMTWAWYGHLSSSKKSWALWTAIVVSWLIALPEYILQVPANRLGHFTHGGPFTAPQLKIIQEAITLTVFAVFSILVLRERLRPNDVVAFLLVMAAVVVSMLGRESGMEAPGRMDDGAGGASTSENADTGGSPRAD